MMGYFEQRQLKQMTAKLKAALMAGEKNLITQICDTTGGASPRATVNVVILPDDIDKAIAIVKGVQGQKEAEEIRKDTSSDEH